MLRSTVVVFLLFVTVLSSPLYAKAKQEIRLLPSPLPVRVITDDAEAKRIAEGDAATVKHESEDLVAQQQAANAALRAAIASERQSILAECQLALSVLSALLGVVGAYFIYSTFREARRANELTRNAYLSSHRPRLRVRDFRHNRDTGKYQFAVTNVGDTIAILDDHAGAWIKSCKEPPGVSDYAGGGGNASGNGNIKLIKEQKTLMPGADTILSSATALTYESNFDEFAATQSTSDSALYFYGWILYTDTLKVTRRTAFCRKFDIKSKRFKPVDDVDCEYED